MWSIEVVGRHHLKPLELQQHELMKAKSLRPEFKKQILVK